MSLTVSTGLIEKTAHPELDSYRTSVARFGRDRDLSIDIAGLGDEALRDLMTAAQAVEDSKTVRAIESILTARSGDFNKPIPSFKAFEGVLSAFFQHDLIDGWLYVTGDDGQLYPELVTGIKYDDGRNMRGSDVTPTVTIKTAYYGRTSNGRSEKVMLGVTSGSHTFQPQDVVRRRVADILAASGIYKETPALKAEYEAAMKRHRDVTLHAFRQQFRANGAVKFYEADDYRRRGVEVENRRVIHDLEPSNYGAFSNHVESKLLEKHEGHAGVGAVPEHPVIRVFDLKTHEFYWVHSAVLTPYKYDKTLRDKLILPPSHRDLLDVLTSDLGAFVEDIIEGKSAGNVILCKGIPGVGKTLTAEVYAELIERPLYSIHSGSLGTSASQIEKSLQMIFQRAKRWDCVLLLDEADVFVVQRGDNIEQNAIVAEFLRTLEYFDGLLFMTTNRPNDIDEAIVSRCAAIIGYTPPSAKDAAAIWRVMAAQYKAEVGDDLITGLVELFPTIAPRDIKMLFRLALRVAKGRNETLTLETFRRCAMFRAIDMKSEGEAE